MSGEKSMTVLVIKECGQESCRQLTRDYIRDCVRKKYKVRISRNSHA